LKRNTKRNSNRDFSDASYAIVLRKLSIQNLILSELKPAMPYKGQGGAGQTTFALANWR
jgi:hypothetical protein